MKKEITNHFAVFPLVGLLALNAPISQSAANINIKSKVYQSNESTLDHNALAKRYERIARKMQIQIKEEQKVLLTDKVASSHSGIKERYLNSSKLIKIRGCKHAVKENLAKAAYHRSLAAEKTDQDAVMNRNQSNKQHNKVRKELEEHNTHSL